MLSNIPTNIITGFLGSGKTTAIRHLLAQRADGANWAVLVNEFGETGVDGALLDDQGVAIREVPGGCMCCAAGVPMQVALNQLLARARPQRLLIEPTGLGHPGALIRTLTGEHLASVLDLRAVITLFDARKLADARYTEHKVFREQLAVADVLVASKADLYDDTDQARLDDFLKADPELRDRPCHPMSAGRLSLDWLDQPSRHGAASGAVAPPRAPQLELDAGAADEPALPAAGYRSSFNQGEGHVSAGWRFRADFVFRREAIEALIRSHPAERIKAVVNTGEGRLRLNREGESLERERVDTGGESRLEFIARADTTLDGLEQQLFDSLTQGGD